MATQLPTPPLVLNIDIPKDRNLLSKLDGGQIIAGKWKSLQIQKDWVYRLDEIDHLYHLELIVYAYHQPQDKQDTHILYRPNSKILHSVNVRLFSEQSAFLITPNMFNFKSIPIDPDIVPSENNSISSNGHNGTFEQIDYKLARKLADMRGWSCTHWKQHAAEICSNYFKGHYDNDEEPIQDTQKQQPPPSHHPHSHVINTNNNNNKEKKNNNNPQLALKGFQNNPFLNHNNLNGIHNKNGPSPNIHQYQMEQQMTQ